MQLNEYTRIHRDDSMKQLCQERDRLVSLMRKAEQNMPIEEDYFFLLTCLNEISQQMVLKYDISMTELQVAEEAANCIDEDGTRDNLVDVVNFVIEKDVFDTTLDLEQINKFVKELLHKEGILLDYLDNLYQTVPYKNSYDFIIRKKSKAMSKDTFEQLYKEYVNLTTKEKEEDEFKKGVEVFRNHWNEENKK